MSSGSGRRSSATRAGMMAARLRGIHCGRALAFCWSDEAEANVGRIRADGGRPTVVRSPDEVLGCARQGMTVAAASRSLGVSRMTLARALGQRGLREEYERLRAEARSEREAGP